ncbi:hypothetical protein IUD23_04075 [Xylella fastidiosa subsp. morus]|uniref:hypothetical protein n=1 Tax=Xylella fastidiosa TaxID=2371 RepID=UPI001F163451|nr:hypothetical protein [Xylella fastidiosa]UIN28674.1 hypothetical protein IUD23_04075 [Xylella fastidiosa subsp. morus]
MQRPFPERNRDAHGAGQRFPDHSKTPNHPTTQLPNYPTTQLPNYPTTQLPNYPTTQLPNYPTTQLPNYPTTQLPNYPTTQLPNYPSGKQQHSLSNATAGHGRADHIAHLCSCVHRLPRPYLHPAAATPHHAWPTC